MEVLWDLVVTSIWAPETYLKFLFLALTGPFWWPLARAMYQELRPALDASPDPAESPRLAPGIDPFLNIPLASHRARRAAATGASARTGAFAARGLGRRNA